MVGMVGIENRSTAAGHDDGRITSGQGGFLLLMDCSFGNFDRAASAARVEAEQRPARFFPTCSKRC